DPRGDVARAGGQAGPAGAAPSGLLAPVREEIDLDHGMIRDRSGGTEQGEPDGKHQERRDLVGDERRESAVTHLEVVEGAGLLHGQPEPAGEGSVEARDAGAATAHVDGAQATGGARRLREVGRGALDTDGDLLAARGDDVLELRRVIV